MHLTAAEQLEIAHTAWAQADKLQMSLLRKSEYIRARQGKATPVEYALQCEELTLLEAQREAARKVADQRWARLMTLQQAA